MSIEITFRTLKGSTFTVTANESETIRDLKRKFAVDQKIARYAEGVLIHNGKVLQDDSTISSAAISTSGFVVALPPKGFLMKQTTTPSSSKIVKTMTAAPSSSGSAENYSDSGKKPTNSPEYKYVSPPLSVESEKKLSGSVRDSTYTSDKAFSSVPRDENHNGHQNDINQMGDMPRRARRSTHYSLDHLDPTEESSSYGRVNESEVPLSSIPTSVSKHSGLSPACVSASSSEYTVARSDSDDALADSTSFPIDCSYSSRTDAPNTVPFNMFALCTSPTFEEDRESGSVNSPLRFMHDFLVFREMRRAIRTNPAVFPQVLQDLETVNPDLLQLIRASPRDFILTMNEPWYDGEDLPEVTMEQLMQAIGSRSSNSAQVSSGTSLQVNITEEENEQIMRLTEFASTIGINQTQVLNAWLACDRDEDLTASVLFDDTPDNPVGQGNGSHSNDSTNLPEDEPEDEDISQK